MDRSAGSVRVRLIAAPINPSDLITIAGTYSRTVFPFTPGFEGVAEVVEADGDSNIRPGQRVIAVRSAGSWATLRDVLDSNCIVVPPHISDLDAATAFINPLTAIAAVDQFLGHHQAAVITAASSTMAGQLAALLRARGIGTIGIVRNSASRVVNPADWTSIIRCDAATWQGQIRSAAADTSLVFDAVGGPHTVQVARSMTARPLKVISYGLLSGRSIEVEALPAGTDVRFLHLRSLVHAAGRKELQTLFDQAFEHIHAGLFRTRISSLVPIDEIARALTNPIGGGKTLLVGSDSEVTGGD